MCPKAPSAEKLAAGEEDAGSEEASTCAGGSRTASLIDADSGRCWGRLVIKNMALHSNTSSMLKLGVDISRRFEVCWPRRYEEVARNWSLKGRIRNTNSEVISRPGQLGKYRRFWPGVGQILLATDQSRRFRPHWRDLG